MSYYSSQQRAVINLQKYLRTLSFFDNCDIPAVEVDGIFESNTKKALEIYQKSKGIDPTGIADKQTYDSLYKNYKKIMERNEALNAPFYVPQSPKQFEYSEGSHGTDVYFLKYILNELKIQHSHYSHLEMNDIYDNNVSKAVQSIQKTYFLPETGDVDMTTWNQIIADYNKTQKNYMH